MKKEEKLFSIYNNEFVVFKNKIENDIDIEYDVNNIHRIHRKEFDNEGYYLVLCIQDFDDIKWTDMEIWKVYKTSKYYHVIEHDNVAPFCLKSLVIRDFIKKVKDFSSDYKIYSYYDYDIESNETELWRGSTSVYGIKLPQDFEL